MFQVIHSDWNVSIADMSMALFANNPIEMFAHGVNMRPELLQNCEFTVDIFAVR